MRATRFSDVVVGHGEGPVWWPEEGLRITDAYRGRIVSLGADGTVTGSVTVGSFVGAFRPRVGGGVVAAALCSSTPTGRRGTSASCGAATGCG
jgi:sugar lactone lactonase YvrE